MFRLLVAAALFAAAPAAYAADAKQTEAKQEGRGGVL